MKLGCVELDVKMFRYGKIIFCDFFRDDKKMHLEARAYWTTGAALGAAAVILFERYEQKDKSGSAGPQGNAQI
jgi:hypothetical protein